MYIKLAFRSPSTKINGVMKTYCVATAIIQDGEQYFIARRAKTKKIAPDLWEFVTGFVEDHEAAEDTIIRELVEEIGAKGTITRNLKIIQMDQQGERWVIIPFLVRVSRKDIHLSPDEHSAGRWVSWAELENVPEKEFRYDPTQLKDSLATGLQPTSSH
jgi:mutator protein MutT